MILGLDIGIRIHAHYVIMDAGCRPFLKPFWRPGKGWSKKALVRLGGNSTRQIELVTDKESASAEMTEFHFY